MLHGGATNNAALPDVVAEGTSDAIGGGSFIAAVPGSAIAAAGVPLMAS